MYLFSVTFKWYERKKGPTHNIFKQKVNTAGQLPKAVREATNKFYKERTAKEKFDVKSMGLKIEVQFVGEVKEETKDASCSTSQTSDAQNQV